MMNIINTKKCLVPLLLMLFGVGMVSAALNINTPAADAYLQGTQVGLAMINVTVTGMINVTNLSFYYTPRVVGGSKTYITHNSTNESWAGSNPRNMSNATGYTISWTISSLQDNLTGGYNLTVDAYNGSNILVATATKRVYMDNYVPSAVWISETATKVKNGGFVNWTSHNATSCTTFFGTNSYTATLGNGGGWYHTVTKTSPPDAAYGTYFECTDGRNTSTSSTIWLTIDAISAGNNQVPIVKATAEKVVVQQKTTQNRMILLAIILVAVVFILIQNKGGRRR